MIRLIVETSENQKKMNKTLGELLNFHKAETPSACNLSILGNIVSPYLLHAATPIVPEEGREGERKRRDRDRSRHRETEVSKPDKRSRSPDSSIESSSRQTGLGAGGGIDHEFEEMKWGLNMALIGQKSSDMFSLHVLSCHSCHASCHTSCSFAGTPSSSRFTIINF